MDVTVTGRHVTVTDDFRAKVTERLADIERLRGRVNRIEVQVSAQPHSTPDEAIACEITLVGRGPVIRATATAQDKSVAFEEALDKLKVQVRKAEDRRKSRQGLRINDVLAPEPLPEVEPAVPDDEPATRDVAGIEVTGDGPLVVREKTFETEPLTLAQALDEMELVGHDFFLYVDAATKAPSVVYRRKAYDYGVLHLSVTGE